MVALAPDVLLVADYVCLGQSCPLLLYWGIIVVAALALIQAMRELRLAQMNVSLCVLIYEILAKYFASHWSFTAKGLMLVLCGGLLLMTNVFIIRNRKRAVVQEVVK